MDASALEQYWAARRNAAVLEASSASKVRMLGGDALDLLHRITTQDLASLAPGQGRPTILTSDKGRVVDLVTVYRMDEHLLLVGSPGSQDAVLAHLDKYTIIEDSEASDATADLGMLLLLGPEANAAAKRAGLPQGLDPHHHARASIRGVDVTVARASTPLGDGYRLLAPPTAMEALRGALAAAGADQINPEAYEALRVEAGEPAYGAEMTDAYNPFGDGAGRPHQL